MAETVRFKVSFYMKFGIIGPGTSPTFPLNLGDRSFSTQSSSPCISTERVEDRQLSVCAHQSLAELSNTLVQSELGGGASESTPGTGVTHPGALAPRMALRLLH